MPDIEVAPEQRVEPTYENTRTPDPEPTPEPVVKPEPKAGEITDTKVIEKGNLKISVKPRSRFTERISDLVHQRNEANARASALESRMRTPEQLPATPSGSPAGGDAAITPDQFDTYGQYVEALVAKTIGDSIKKQQGINGEAAFQRDRAEKMEAFNDAAAPLIAEHGDAFMEAISDPNLPISEPMADAVMELEDLAPYVMLWLAANPQESLKMAKMNPRAATVAIGRLAARLDYEIKGGGSAEGASVGAQTPVAAAPRPSVVPTPRGGSPADVGAAPNDKDSIEEWMRKESVRLRGKFGPGFRAYGMR